MRAQSATLWCGSLLLLVLPRAPIAAQAQTRFINPPSLVKPNGYTHLVVAPDARTVYVAGQVAFDSAGQLVGGGDFRVQADRVYQNLRRALTAVGGSLDDVVKTTTFITDLKNVPALREVRAQHSRSGRPPANTLVVVSSLARPELMIEIEAVAVLQHSVRFAE
jgi:enamine deaminase RidA (YjgF/YER057c/UK114 family)